MRTIVISSIACIVLLTLLIAGTKFIPSSRPVIQPFAPSLPLLTSSPTPSTQPTWTLLLTGDIIPARVVNQKMVEKQDFSWPIIQIADILRKADITLANLEAPLLDHCPVTNEGFTFCGDAHFTKSLADSGIDIVNLANNHSHNFGWEGIQETEKHLAENNILSTGFTMNDAEMCKQDMSCSKVLIYTVHSLRIGFLGYNAVGQRLDEEKIYSQIHKLKQSVDFLVVSVHWGKEYERNPVPDSSLAPDDPKIWGRKFIDWGADVVNGNHPHWYQGIEWYVSPSVGIPKPIVYAQGNTVFDQEWSTETKRGYLVQFTISGTSISQHMEIFPIGIRDWGQAYILEGKEKEDVISFVNSFN